MQTLLPKLIFLAIFIVVMLIFIFHEKKNNSKWIRERFHPSIVKQGEKKEIAWWQKLLVDLGNRTAPTNQTAKMQAKKQLSYAGYRSGFALEIYFGIRAVLPLGAAFICILYLILKGNIDLRLLYLSFLVIVSGYYLPLIILKSKIKTRKSEIFKELPNTLDLLVLCSEAGLGFEMALMRVSKELKDVAPILSKEFTQYFFETRGGVARNEALENMKKRNDSPGLGAVVDVALQSMRFGTNIASALRVHSEFMRTERFQIAEEKGAKIAVKLTLPLVFLVLPALLIIVLGPAILQLLEYFAA